MSEVRPGPNWILPTSQCCMPVQQWHFRFQHKTYNYLVAARLKIKELLIFSFNLPLAGIGPFEPGANTGLKGREFPHSENTVAFI